MRVLTSLLPGLRQLRAPLASGYLWLVTVGLALARFIPQPAEVQPGIIKEVYDTAAVAGHSAVAVALTFAAYLVGVLSVQATAILLPTLRVLRKQPSARSRRRTGTTVPSAAGQQTLREAVLDQLAVRYDGDPELTMKLKETQTVCGVPGELSDSATRRALLDVRFDIDAYARSLEDDLPLMPLRLLGEDKEREIYSEFDRTRAEAEFRAAVALPLAALVVVIAARTSLWWLLALVLPALLVLEAQRQAAAAADVLAESIRARAPHSPALDQVRAGPLQERKAWVRYAAERGYVQAMIRWAKDLENTGDTGAAEDWYRKAAEKNEPTAMIWLAGRLHLRGDPTAESWYEKAATAGEPIAVEMKNSAREFTSGQLFDFKAAHAGNPIAMTRMGEYYEQLEKLEDAEGWYRKATESGHSPALQKLVALLRRLGKPIAAEQLLRNNQMSDSKGSQIRENATDPTL